MNRDQPDDARQAEDDDYRPEEEGREVLGPPCPICGCHNWFLGTTYDAGHGITAQVVQCVNCDHDDAWLYD